MKKYRDSIDGLPLPGELPSRVPTQEDYDNWSPHGNTFAPISQLLEPQNRTDDEAGRRFAREHGEVVRYVAAWNKWLVWDGRRWAVDDCQAIQAIAKLTNDAVWGEVLQLVADQRITQQDAAAARSWGKYVSSVNGTEHMLSKASSEPGIVCRHGELDRGPWLLNVENGTIDLRTGQLRPHSKADLITKLAPVTFDANADCPKWRAFVDEIMSRNVVLVGYLRKLVGYWLTGIVRDHILPLFIGTGANGKSVFLNTVQSLIGADYCMKAPADFLLAKKNATHPTELADLFGKRLVSCIEIESGRRLAESLVKELTGGDPIRARRMREDFWQFDPTHKVVLAANHRPVVRGRDNGVWRRLRVVPFDIVIPAEKQNKKLTEELQSELPGILNWALLGCLEWQAEGLGEPAEVMAATADYKGENDLIGAFITDMCVTMPSISVAAGQLFAAYQQWCSGNGHLADNSTTFGRDLTERGFDVKPTKKGKVRCGIGLMATEHSTGDQ